eukprot:scaffold122179_cov27-Tisochrysis_lutea.AAC.2
MEYSEEYSFSGSTVISHASLTVGTSNKSAVRSIAELRERAITHVETAGVLIKTTAYDGILQRAVEHQRLQEVYTAQLYPRDTKHPRTALSRHLQVASGREYHLAMHNVIRHKCKKRAARR